MKLILTHEVAGLGTPGDMVEVKDGYGRNFLDAARPRRQVDQGRRAADRVDPEGPPVARRSRHRRGHRRSRPGWRTCT